MRMFKVLLATAAMAIVATGCETVDTTNPTAPPDTTAATFGIVVTGEDWYPDTVGGAPVAHPFTLSTRERRGNEPITPLAEGRGQFGRDVRNLNVIMTAQDPQSGIRRMALRVNRDVCYRQPGASDWSSPFYDHNGTFPYDGQIAERASEATFSNPASLPTSPVIAHNLSRGHLLRVVLSPGVERDGAGGVFTFYGEAANGGGGTTVYALPLILGFGDLGCIGAP